MTTREESELAFPKRTLSTIASYERTQWERTKQNPSLQVVETNVRSCREQILEVYQAVQKERGAQEVSRYSPFQITILLFELAELFRRHLDAKRRSGEFVIEDHLLPTALTLIETLGITRLEDVTSAVKHDDVEDLGISLDEVFQPAKYIEALQRVASGNFDLERELLALRIKIMAHVDAVSKVQLETRAATKTATLRKFLEAILKYGIRVAYLKLADRITNINTLKGQHRDRVPDILDETEQVYLPLARYLSTRDALEELVKGCLKARKEILGEPTTLLEDFERIQTERLAAFAPYEKTIRLYFTPPEEPSERGPITSEALRRIAEGVGILGRRKDAGNEDPMRRTEQEIKLLQRTEFTIERTRISDYLPEENIPLSDLTIDQFSIPLTDPMFDIVLTVPSDADIKPLLQYIYDYFGALPGVEHRDEGVVGYPIKLGRKVIVKHRRFGGEISFLVTTKRERARAKRGRLQESSSDELRADVAEPIEAVLDETRNERSLVRIHEIAHEKLLRPPLTVRTPHGDAVTLPPGSTALDFSRMVNPALAIGFLTARKKDRTRHRGSAKKPRWVPLLSPFDDLEDLDEVEVTSCLAKGNLYPEQTTVDPGWPQLVNTKGARIELQRYLEAPVTYMRQVLEKIIAAPASRAKEIEKEEARRALEKLSSQNDREESLVIGDRFLQRTAFLFGFRNADEMIEFLRTKSETLRDKNPEEIRLMIGQGKFDLLEFFANHWKDKSEWRLEVNLPHVSGAINRFTDEFARRGVQLEEVVFQRTGAPTPERRKENERRGTVIVSDPSGKYDPKEFLRIFLKYTYLGYQIRLTP